MTFFFACRGAPETAQAWETDCRAAAGRRSAGIEARSVPLGDGSVLLFGWIAAQPAGLDTAIEQDDKSLRLATLPGSAGRLIADLETGDIALIAPATSPEQIYYLQREGNLFITNDFRLLLGRAGFELNAAAVFAILQIGAIPAPLTILRDVKRVPPGQTVTISRAGAERALPFVWKPAGARLSGANAADEIARRLQNVLPAPGTPVALLFSGGVDSTLLAIRLAQDGHKDAALVNYAFADDDPESAAAEEIAGHLGLPFLRILHEDRSIEQVIAKAGDAYSYPFGDVSTLPTNALIEGVINRTAPDSLVIEGTGADAIFGLTQRLALWTRYTSVPAAVLRAAGAGYRQFGMWRFDGPLRKLCWVMRTRSQMPLIESAVMSQNSLNGIAYHIPARDRETLTAIIHDHYIEPLDGHDLNASAGMANLMHRCSGYCAAKSFDPLRAAGRRVLYPFLTPAMADLAALTPGDCKYRAGTEKYVLKEMLKAALPPHLIDRAKSRFEPPMARYLRMPGFQAYLRDAVLSPRNPVLDFVDAPATRRMIDYASRHDMTNREVHNYLWALTFLTAWVGAQAEERRRAA